MKSFMTAKRVAAVLMAVVVVSSFQAGVCMKADQQTLLSRIIIEPGSGWR